VYDPKRVSETPTTKPERAHAREAQSRPDRVDRYRLKRQIGEGGMGVVWVAHDLRLGRDVALKIMGGDGIGTEARARLAREARSMARVSHPNVVQVFDSGTFEGASGEPQVFIAMELVDGEDLSARLEALRATDRWRVGAAWAELVALFVEAGEGLAAAHASGLVHRDFKPANVLVDREGRVRVGDFGLSRGDADDDRHEPMDGFSTNLGASAADGVPSARSRQPESDRPDADADDGSAGRRGSEDDAYASEEAMTKTGTVLGTPGYIAPELFHGERADDKSDQWSFCVSLWEALHGQRPIRAASFPELALATVEGRFEEPPPKPPVPTRLRAILRRGLDVDPTRRFASMRALVDALRDELERPRRRRRRFRLFAALGTALVVGIGSVVLWTSHEVAPCADAGAPVDEVWNAARRARVDAHVRALPVSFAQRLAEDAVRAADHYASELGSSYRGACEATFVRETQSQPLLDRRVACLDRRRAELDAFAAELADADVDAVERLTRALQLSPTFAACADASALLSGVDPPPSALVEAVDRAHRTIASARAAITSGEVTEALRRAALAQREVDRIDYAPLRVDAHLAQGQALVSAGRFDDASRELRAAFYGSLGIGDRDRRVEAATALVDVDGVRRTRPELGDVWAEIAGGTLASFEEERPELQSRLENVLAELRSAQGKRDEALTHAARAVELVERARGAEDLALLEPLRQLGDVRARLRDFVGAIEPLERTRRLASVLPEAHPERIAIEARLSAALVGAGRSDEALPMVRRARDLAIESLPEAHPVLAFARLKHADALVHSGRVDEALPEYRAALHATIAAYGPEHTEVARALLNLAGAEARAGRTDEAIARWREALAMRERLLGPNHPDLAIILQNVGSVETERGRAREALGVLERAWRIRHESPASPLARADLDYWYGRALYESGEDPARGRALVARGEATARREGYDAPAGDMERWLATHPEPARAPARR
jgi:serine/threonine protein kinase/tetratricopeptide (TPR) repeat protein